MKVFIDSDVILDVVMEREPFYHDSALILDLSARGYIDGVTSPVVIANVYYISRKPADVMQDLLNIVSVVPITHEMMVNAFASKYDDKEDAIQYYTALKAKAKYLITRNTRDYEYAQDVGVMSPEEFLRLGSVKSKIKNR